MSGHLNGSPVRRIRPSSSDGRLTALEDWQRDHQAECETGSDAVTKRLDAVEAAVTKMSGQVELLVKAFIREKEHADGSKSVVWTIPKPSWKTVGKVILSFSSVVVFLQLLIFLAGHAVQWVANYGH